MENSTTVPKTDLQVALERIDKIEQTAKRTTQFATLKADRLALRNKWLSMSKVEKAQYLCKIGIDGESTERWADCTIPIGLPFKVTLVKCDYDLENISGTQVSVAEGAVQKIYALRNNKTRLMLDLLGFCINFIIELKLVSAEIDGRRVVYPILTQKDEYNAMIESIVALNINQFK